MSALVLSLPISSRADVRAAARRSLRIQVQDAEDDLRAALPGRAISASTSQLSRNVVSVQAGDAAGPQIVATSIPQDLRLTDIEQVAINQRARLTRRYSDELRRAGTLPVGGRTARVTYRRSRRR